ncbi:MAG: 30S ribosomal protein S8, partial [Bacteroidota bacterium]
MAVTDPIADYLTRIRNAQQAGHRVVTIPASKLKKSMTEILYDQGYILKYKFDDGVGAGKQGTIS